MKKSRKPTALNSSLQSGMHEIFTVHQLSKVAMTFWLGGSWMTIIVVVPILFKVLDQITASLITGQILNINAYIGIVCLILALIEVVVSYKLYIFKVKKFWYILIMGFILTINHFALFPLIYNLRKSLSDVAHQIITTPTNLFDFWHSLSAIIFIVTCIIGILYLIEK